MVQGSNNIKKFIYSHSAIRPLRFLQDVQTRVNDKLVHVLRGLREAEPGNAIATSLGRPECDIE
jgi:hypothetical protein